MKSTHWTKRLAVAGVLAACVGGGATWVAGQGAASHPAAPPAVAPTTPTAGQSIATVNGQEIDAQKFNNLLMEVAGLRVFQEVLDLVLVQQACTGAGIPITGPEFEKHVKEELDRTYDGLIKQGVPKEDVERVLAGILQKQGVTNVEFQMGLQRAAGLRLLAKGKVDAPTKQEIQSAFDAEYGPKVQIEVMTVKDRKMAADVRDKVDKGEEPRAIAGAMGIPWQQLTIPANNTDPDPISTFKDLAFKELKEKQLSATIPFTPKGGTEVFYLVYLAKKEAAKSVLLPAVEKTVEEQVMAAKEQNWMNQRLMGLRTAAAVVINNEIIKKQFAAILEQMQRNAAATQAAATQSKTPLNTPPEIPPVLPPTTLPGLPK